MNIITALCAGQGAPLSRGHAHAY